MEQCRQWLKGLQVFVLALQKDVEYLSKLNISVGTGAAAGCGQHLGLEPQPHPAWNRLLQNAHEKLQRLLVQEVSHGVSCRPQRSAHATVKAWPF